MTSSFDVHFITKSELANKMIAYKTGLKCKINIIWYIHMIDHESLLVVLLQLLNVVGNRVLIQQSD